MNSSDLHAATQHGQRGSCSRCAPANLLQLRENKHKYVCTLRETAEPHSPTRPARAMQTRGRRCYNGLVEAGI